MSEEYELMKKLFMNYVKATPGPWRLEIHKLARLYVAERINIPDSINISLTREVMDPIWKKMVFELCPLQMVIPDSKERDIIADIKEIDDNVDYIYAYAKLATDKKTRVLQISNPVIAAMLRIKHGS